MKAIDISLTDEASFLLFGDGGTKKTTFIGTCPTPSYIFDFDGGMASLAGYKDIEYDTFKEMPKEVKEKDIPQNLRARGFVEWGTAWSKFLDRLNVIGKSIDAGTCQYKVLGVDSLTTLTDVAQSHILRGSNHKGMEIQDWGAFLYNMSQVFSQLTTWPLIKVVTAHVKRMENDLTKLEEKLPLLPGQMAGKIGIYFDEVYHTQLTVENKIPKFTLQTLPDNIVKQVKSRKYNIPSGTETSYKVLLPFITKRQTA